MSNGHLMVSILQGHAHRCRGNPRFIGLCDGDGAEQFFGYLGGCGSQIPAGRKDRRSGVDHAASRFIGVQNAPFLRHDDDADRHAVERRPQGLLFQALHIHEIADRQRAADVRSQQPQDRKVSFRHKTMALMPRERQRAQPVGLAHHDECQRIDDTLRLYPFVEVTGLESFRHLAACSAGFAKAMPERENFLLDLREVVSVFGKAGEPCRIIVPNMRDRGPSRRACRRSNS